MKSSPPRLKLIAEFCQNHNGDFEVVRRMIGAAAAHGATYAKIQTIFAEEIAYRPQFEQGLIEGGVTLSIKRPYQPEYDRLKKLELSYDQARRFVALCREAGLEPLTTCFTRAQVVPLSEIGFRAIKVASYDCASFPMLRELRARFPRLIVSTGATYDDEIRHAADILAGSDFAFLHCVTLYPTPIEQSHLARIRWLRELAPEVGYSDHSLVVRDGVIASKIAIYLGAEIIERHFTILPASETRDGPVSITPEMLADLVEFARLDAEAQTKELDRLRPDWRSAIGTAQRTLSDQELLNRDYYRGRFASRRPESRDGKRMIFNWEEVPLTSSAEG
jgi:N,N'-diacetyllegionaminate synthase